MPAKKAGRQSVKRAQRNRSARTETRTTIAKAQRSLASGNADEAAGTVRDAIRVMDRAVQKGILHKNNVARRKSRMAHRLNRVEAPEAL